MDKRAIVLLAAFTMAASGVAIGAITNSDHDFTGEGWADSEICKPCHVPHNAVTGLIAPLWNHELTTSTYTTYDGTAGVATEDALDSYSILCMSCHDGTVALDSFGGATGSTSMTGGALLDADLQDDHPIGATAIYDATDPEYNDITGTLDLRPMTISGVSEDVVSCATCHDVHDSQGTSSLLQIDNAGSALCLTCHNK